MKFVIDFLKRVYWENKPQDDFEPAQPQRVALGGQFCEEILRVSSSYAIFDLFDQVKKILKINVIFLNEIFEVSIYEKSFGDIVILIQGYLVNIIVNFFLRLKFFTQKLINLFIRP